MLLKNLYIENFRNFLVAESNFCNKFNILYGENGSGKTNFLESIYYLSLGRSFRCPILPRLIKHGSTQFLLRCNLNLFDKNVLAGISRNLDGAQQIHIGGEKVGSIAEMTRIMPVLFFNQDAFQFLCGGPKFKRQILDWGVFHVEHSLLSLWQRFNQALIQRNAALKTRATIEHIKSWDCELAASAMELHEKRAAYFAKFEPVFRAIFSNIFDALNIKICYHSGWNLEHDLQDVFSASLARDRQLGYTQFGPQRANIEWSINGVAPQEILSRGQQKMFILALYLAQESLLYSATQKQCAFLIDDLMAELDREKQKLAMQLLSNTEAQIFVTSINKDELEKGVGECRADVKMFHVEQGRVEEKRSEV